MHRYEREVLVWVCNSRNKLSVEIMRSGGAKTNLPVCFTTPPVVKRSKNSIDVTVHESRSALTLPAAPDADHETEPLLQRKCCCTTALRMLVRDWALLLGMGEATCLSTATKSLTRHKMQRQSMRHKRIYECTYVKGQQICRIGREAATFSE